MLKNTQKAAIFYLELATFFALSAFGSFVAFSFLLDWVDKLEQRTQSWEMLITLMRFSLYAIPTFFAVLATSGYFLMAAYELKNLIQWLINNWKKKGK